MNNISDEAAKEITERILNMPKYRKVEIPSETVSSLIEICLPMSNNAADLEKRVREKVHNIIAPYLGEINYIKALNEFLEIKNDTDILNAFAGKLLSSHASTKERGAILSSFYYELFRKIGTADKIADLACGFHPVGLPFMGLLKDTSYFAYDLHKQRADFLNTYITTLGYKGGCFHRDILIDTPQMRFDVAFFFKEAHRFEKREPGVIPGFLDKINASKIIVSLPIKGLSKNNPLSAKHETIIRTYASDRGYNIDSYEYNNEIFYIIDKGT